MATCYICGDKASGSCYKCGKSVCQGHLVNVRMTSYCTNCAQTTRKRGYIIGGVVFVIFLLIFLIVFLPMFLNFPAF